MAIFGGTAAVFFNYVKYVQKVNFYFFLQLTNFHICQIYMKVTGNFFQDGGKISEHGFFHGYDNFVWFTVLQNALGGLLVAVVVKYADNILKVSIYKNKESEINAL